MTKAQLIKALSGLKDGERVVLKIDGVTYQDFNLDMFEMEHDLDGDVLVHRGEITPYVREVNFDEDALKYDGV